VLIFELHGGKKIRRKDEIFFVVNVIPRSFASPIEKKGKVLRSQLIGADSKEGKS
jgi:hypothetical protein